MNLTEYRTWLFQSSADAKAKLGLTSSQRAYAEMMQASMTLLEVIVEEMERNSPTESLLDQFDQKIRG